MKCETNQELILLYVADVLDEQEQVELVAHLESGCSACNQALDEARGVVGMLPLQLPIQSAPADSTDLFMKAVRNNTPPVSAAESVSDSIQVHQASVGSRVARTEDSGTQGDSGFWKRAGWIVALAAVLVVALTSGTIWWITKTIQTKNSEIASLEQHVDMRENELFLLVDDHDRYERLSSMLNSPNTEFAALVGALPQQNAETENDNNLGRISYAADKAELFLFARDLPEISETEVFHLWVQTDSGPFRVGSFQGGGAGETTVNIRNIAQRIDISTAFVTIEKGEPATPGDREIARAEKA